MGMEKDKDEFQSDREITVTESFKLLVKEAIREMLPEIQEALKEEPDARS